MMVIVMRMMMMLMGRWVSRRGRRKRKTGRRQGELTQSSPKGLGFNKSFDKSLQFFLKRLEGAFDDLDFDDDDDSSLCSPPGLFN